jgi:ABC-2 type transport system permease protein
VSARLHAWLRAWAALVRTSLRLALREPVALFWNTAAPAFLLLAFGFVFGQIPHAIGWLTAGLICIGTMGTAFYGLAVSLVTQREQLVLRRYGATPVSTLAIVLAELTTGSALALIAAAIQVAIAVGAFGLRIADRAAPLALAVLASILAFMGLGLAIATLCTRTRTALVAAHALFLPLMFLGGAAIPLPILPPGVERLSTLLPSRHAVEAIASAIALDEPPRGPTVALIFLLATAAAGVAIAVAWFRFDPDQGLPARSRIGALAAFAALSGAAFTLGSGGDAAAPGAAGRPRAEYDGPSMLDDFADGDLESAHHGTWTAFTDRIPLLLGRSRAEIENVPDPEDSTRRALAIGGEVTADALHGGFAGASLALADARGGGLDLSGTRGLRLRVRGDGGSYRIVVATPPLTNFDHLCWWFDAPPRWRSLEIPWSAFTRTGFGPAREAGIESTLAIQVLSAGAPRAGFSLWIADVEVLR